jgi:parvulin-like peptidyl-prolyl isomerase
MKLSRWALVAAPLAVAACGLGGAMKSQADVVAKAAGKELRVEDAAQILAANPQIPTDPQVVRQLADLWVDYTLLATAAAEDTSLSVLDLDDFVKEEQEEQVVYRYLEAQVKPDTSFTDAELDQLWNTEGPGVEVRARHILLKPAAEATPAQREQLRARAEAIRVRAAGGEDFAALARETTEEPGGKERGGDLDWFGRGRMVPQFEEAAFKLQAGQVSPVVETPFGYHVIKVEDRKQQPIGENREGFRQHLKGTAQQRALTTYIDSLRKTAKVVVQTGAEESVRELAGQENLNLRGRAASRQLVAYQGGEVTAAELAESMQGVPGQGREQLKAAPAEQVKEFLETQALKEFLAAEARQKNFRLPAAAADSIRTQAREAIREILRMSGLANRRFPKGKAGNGAIQEAVRNLMEQAVAGQRQLPPLAKLGYALRNAYGADINSESFQKVADRMKAIRASQPAPQQQPGFPGGMPPGAEGQPGQPQPGQPQPGQPQPGQPQPGQPQPGQPQPGQAPQPQAPQPQGGQAPAAQPAPGQKQ